MADSQKYQDKEQIKAVEIATNLIESLSRVFKLNLYYPKGHALVDQTVEKFTSLLRDVEPSKRSILLRFDQRTCLVGEIGVDSDSAASRELHKLLSNLGIKGVEFDKAVLPDHVMLFVKKLLAWRIESEASSTFANFDSRNMPETIEIQQQEFVVGPDVDVGEEDDGEETANINDICKRLSEHGLGKAEVVKCRQLLVALSQAPKREKIETSKFPGATWQDIQALLVQVFLQPKSRKPQEDDSERQSDVTALSSIFESLARGLEDEKSKEAIQLLLAYLKEEGAATGTAITKGEFGVQDVRQDPEVILKTHDIHVLSIEQINRFIYENTIPQKIQKNLTKVDHSEDFSINLQLIMSVGEEELIDALCENITSVCQTPITDREKLVLLGGFESLAEENDIDLLYKLLKKILPLFRKHKNEGSLHLILDLHDKLSEAKKSVLWPFMINELLATGFDNNSDTFVELTRKASELPIAAMHSLGIHLESLEAFDKGNIAPVVFEPSLLCSYPLFSFLIETSVGKGIAEKVLGELVKRPQDKLISIMAPLLNLGTTAHDEFLINYLLQAHHEEPPLVLRMAAGQIIVDYLVKIADESKENERLPEIIVSSVELYCRQTKEVLEKVVSEKKFGMLYVWPKNCRKAAWTALKTLQRKKL